MLDRAERCAQPPRITVSADAHIGHGVRAGSEGDQPSSDGADGASGVFAGQALPSHSLGSKPGVTS